MPPETTPQSSLPQHAAQETKAFSAQSALPAVKLTAHLLKKPIKVVWTHAAAIDAELAAVNGKVTSFTLTEALEIIRIAETAEQRLDNLATRSRAGVTASFVPAGPTASACSDGTISTEVLLERRAAGWYLIGVKRAKVYPRSGQRLVIEISRVQADQITRRALSTFRVTARSATRERFRPQGLLHDQLCCRLPFRSV